jgi:hypothetical protein
MDARIKFVAIAVLFFSLGADYSTKNFVVSAPNPALAKQVGLAAEKFRRELALQWLGKELPQWSERCPVTVRIAPQAGGQTSFGFASNGSRSVPIGWQMEVYGSPERILDSVLPHEVTHTIFATHFGRPLPRWADEGACTTVEHESERAKNHELLLRFLTTNRGIPFNRMFVMKQYPHDIYPLYAQGYSLARYLILQGGQQRFISYVGDGMSAELPGRETQVWDAATKKYYGFEDLSELQVRWVGWVKQGCPNLEKAGANAVAQANSNGIPIAPSTRPAPQQSAPAPEVTASGSWYTIQATRPESVQASGAIEIDRSASAASDSEYRPGSIRFSQPIEVLATIAPTNVSTNRINPESIYLTQPQIEAAPSPSQTLWR